MQLSFSCRTCGAVHEDVPVFGHEAPAPYGHLDDAARRGARLDGETCEIGARCFVRARLSFPVEDRPGEKHAWLVWVELAPRDYDVVLETWERTGRENAVPRMRATLAVALPFHPGSEGVDVELQTMPVGQRPEVRVVGACSLRDEQLRGVPLATLVEWAEQLLHGAGEEWLDDVGRALEERFGEPDDIVSLDARGAPTPPPVPRVDIRVWREDERGRTSLATAGMAAQAMPRGGGRAELQMTIADLPRHDERAVAMFLANLSCYPWTIGAALGQWHTLGTQLPIPRFPQCAAVLLREPLVGPDADLATSEGPVQLLQVVPITEEERAIARTGRDALREHFRARNIDLFRDRRAAR